MILFNPNVFGSPPLFNTGEVASTIRGHQIRKRRRGKYKYPIEELVLLPEKEIVELSKEVANQEITELQVEKEQELQKIYATQAEIHKQLLKIELQETELRHEIYLEIKNKIQEYLQEEEDRAILLLI